MAKSESWLELFYDPSFSDLLKIPRCPMLSFPPTYQFTDESDLRIP